VKAILLNRATLVLSYIGVFIAGTLSLSHAMKLTLPCGATGGCERVNSSPYAQWAGIPVAYFGLLTYILLAALASKRSGASPEAFRKLATVGWGVSLVGVGASAYLTYVALNLIRATCDWCLASAAVMVLLFVVHSIMLQSADESAEKPPSGRLDFGLIAALPIIALLGVSVNAATLKSKASSVGNLKASAKSDAVLKRLLKEPNNMKGDKDAPVTVVEFADFLCPACREAFPQLQALISQNPGVNVVYRHYPLYKKPGHENSLLIAQLSEIAAEQGKFWQFAERVINADVKDLETDPEPLLKIMDSIGIDRASFLKRISDEKDPAFERVYADLELANDAGLQITPSFYVLGKGIEPKVISFSELPGTLALPEYQKLLNPASGDGPPPPNNAQ